MRSATRADRPARWTFAVFGALILCCGQAGAGGQSAAPPRDDPHAPDLSAGTGIIRGRVVSAESESAAPIRYARVSVRSSSGSPDPVFTDGAGRFEINGLAAGRYTLTAAKTGFVRTDLGSRSELDPSVPLDLGDGEHLDGIEIRLPRGAAIAGRVLDELGEPLVGAPVLIGSLQSFGAEARWVAVSRPGSLTDDRGEYRIGGLAAGRYYVAVAGASEGSFIAGAPPEWARTVSWGRTFYLGSPGLAGATPIALGAGEERTGIDLAIAPARPARVTVSLTDASGAPATGMVNLLMPGETSGSILANRGVPLSPSNQRMTSMLEPGEWIAVALGNARSLAHVRLSSGEEASLILTLGSGARLSGHVVFEGTTAPPAPASVRLGVRGVGPDAIVPSSGLSSGPATVKADGSFEMTGLVGTIALQPAAPLRGWTLRAVRYRDRDLLDEPLTLSGSEDVSGVEVVFTDRAAELSGVSTDAEGRPSQGCTVAVFPDADGLRFVGRRTRLVRADQHGRFAISDLPNGSYLVAATPDVDASLWQTRDSLDRLRSIATRVSLVDGGKQALTLRCVSLP